jgi:hypothetical protein
MLEDWLIRWFWVSGGLLGGWVGLAVLGWLFAVVVSPLLQSLLDLVEWLVCDVPPGLATALRRGWRRRRGRPHAPGLDERQLQRLQDTLWRYGLTHKSATLLAHQYPRHESRPGSPDHTTSAPR